MSINNGSTNPYPNPPASLSTAAPGSEAESGSGGGEMAVWSTSRSQQLRKLVRADYTNASSYTLPGGVVDLGGYSTGFETHEKTPGVPPSTPTVGEGGGIMDIWYARRTEKLSTLARGNYQNSSSFGIPAGVVDLYGYGSFDTAEKKMGQAVDGQAIAPNGLALEGTLSIIADGEEMAAQVVSGGFIASFEPLDGVVSGDNEGGLPTFDAKYTPTADGIGAEMSNINFPESSYFDVSYGYLAGQVTSYDGEPVADVVVSGEGAATSTNSEGVYYLLAPGGFSVTLESLDGSVSKNVTATTGETEEVDWTYGGIQVRVVGPNLGAIVNAPVTIDGDTYRTDRSGTVIAAQSAIGDHTVRVMDSFETELQLLAEGQLKKYEYEGGARLDIRAFDGVSGEPVRNLPAVDFETQTLSYTAENGLASVLAAGQTDFRIRLGDGDKRYQTEALEPQVDAGEVKSVEVRLSRKTATKNA